MKLETLVKRLDKARSDYWYRFAKDPHIWVWCDGTLTLCARIKQCAPGVYAPDEPIKHYKINNPVEL